MATTTDNLYLVTDTLRRLLQLDMTRSLVERGHDATEAESLVNVTTMPPDLVEGPVVNLHLYHVTPLSLHTGPPVEAPGRSGLPLALSLFYVLTVHPEVSPVFDAESQQFYLGLAMKTLHDHPQVDDNLRIAVAGGSQHVFAPELEGNGNHLNIVLRSLSPEESTNFWAAEEHSTTRLSAHYEVRTVLIGEG